MNFESGCFLCAQANAVKAPEVPLSRRRFLQGAAASYLLAGSESSAQIAGAAAGPGGQPTGARRHLPEAFIISAGWILREREGRLELLRDGHILVRDGLIQALREAPFTDALPTLRLATDLVLPGFISGHTHCASATPTRGIIETPRSYARPLELVESLDDDELDALTAFNLAELLRSGCTTQVEMSLSLRQAESYVRVAERWGVRGFPGAMIPHIGRLFPIWFRDNDQLLQDAQAATLAEIAQNLEFGRRHMGRADGLIQPMMAPHACDTHTPATMQALAAAARELGTGLHIHLSQGQRETDTVRRLWGMTPTQWLEQFGFFAQGPVFGAHMSGLDWTVDPPILKKYGAVYAHCPSAGGAGGGTQPFPEALAAEMPVNIAIDTHSNDYLENLKLSVLYGQARHRLMRQLAPNGLATRAPSILDAVDSATRVAARGLRRNDLGVIRPGAKADLISIDVSGMLVGTGALPPEPLNNLLYANGRMVRTVMTAGRLQVSDGQFVADDVAAITRSGGQVVEKIWSKLAEEGWFADA